MTSNEQLYQDALDAVNKLFSDMSVPKAIARENLKALIGEIETMLESLEE